MATIRFKALEDIYTRSTPSIERQSKQISDYFGDNVFGRTKMRKYLSTDAYDAVCEAIDKGEPINRKMADQVAQGMKSWAIENGATHYTHWFQPLTSGTAEKHDAFIVPDGDGVVEKFSGEMLSQQTPSLSASHIASGRQTFEARGYTAWDASSPAFIIDGTLCIPTVLISYTGESLDYKTPLLRSLSALDKAATEVCMYFDKNVVKVSAQVGWEQEYFLLDEALFRARPDLMLTGRTLLGHTLSKDKQTDTHYFSSIPTRMYRFMEDLEEEAFKLGIPVKTRHNEVAPNQFEMTSMHEEANLSNDHNQLLMDLMKKVARRHKFMVLFHEKPFEGVNGSGKHVNWSLSTDAGVNVFSPGKNPKSNLQFLTFLLNTMKAVLDNQDLFRASIFTPENYWRLGTNEAPSTILSIFLGSEVSKKLDLMESAVTERKMTPDEKTALKLNIARIPEFILDTTDSNRTSPLAFTGNRFEFRAVGASANAAAAITVLNTALAAQLQKFHAEVEKLIAKDVRKDEAIFQVLKKLIVETKKVRFDGNARSKAWEEQALKRGLSKVDSFSKSATHLGDLRAMKLFKSQGVFTQSELESRMLIEFDKFTTQTQVESSVLCNLAINHVIPTAVKYQNVLLQNVQGLKAVFPEDQFAQLAAGELDLIKQMSERVSGIKKLVQKMLEERDMLDAMNSGELKATTYEERILPLMQQIRKHADALEIIVDDEMWSLLKYRELLFVK
ncbi:MAG: glutamine synthetase III [Mangrovibacterium sp.]